MGRAVATISLVFVPLFLCGEIVMLGTHHKGTKAQRKILLQYIIHII